MEISCEWARGWPAIAMRPTPVRPSPRIAGTCAQGAREAEALAHCRAPSTYMRVGCDKRWPLRSARRAGRRDSRVAGSSCASPIRFRDLQTQNLPRSIAAPSHAGASAGSSQSRIRRARIGGLMRLLHGAPDMRVHPAAGHAA